MAEGEAGPRAVTTYVFDACALIDLFESDVGLLGLIARHLGPVVVLTPILGEVTGLEEDLCAELGLSIIEPTLDQMSEAANAGGRLSFYDWLCLIAARDAGWTCVSSDGALLQVCQQQNVATVRGLRPILELVERGHLHFRLAVSAIRAIRTKNCYITVAVVSAFTEELRAAARVARRE